MVMRDADPSWLAQWKSAGLITRKSSDRNGGQLFFYIFFKLWGLLFERLQLLKQFLCYSSKNLAFSRLFWGYFFPSKRNVKLIISRGFCVTSFVNKNWVNCITVSHCHLRVYKVILKNSSNSSLISLCFICLYMKIVASDFMTKVYKKSGFCPRCLLWIQFLSIHLWFYQFLKMRRQFEQVCVRGTLSELLWNVTRHLQPSDYRALRGRRIRMSSMILFFWSQSKTNHDSFHLKFAIILNTM